MFTHLARTSRIYSGVRLIPRFPKRACPQVLGPRFCSDGPKYVFHQLPTTETTRYKVNWILKDGTTKTTEDKEGLNFLEIAHKHGIDLEGACEGSLACSTCHVVVEDPDVYSKLPEPEDEENDMLDLAFGLTDTSRLGCQLILNKEVDGITVRLPRATRNMAVDGYVPKPH